MADGAPAGTVLAAVEVVLLVEGDVVRHVQVEGAVPVRVGEGGAGRPERAADTGLVRDIGERAIPVVAVQDVRPVVGHVQIAIAVAVDVPRGAAETVPLGSPDSGPVGHVLETAVPQVAVQGRAQRPLRREPGQAPALDEVDVLQTVAVVVEDAHTGAERLENVLLSGRPVDVPEGDARLMRDVLETRALRLSCQLIRRRGARIRVGRPGVAPIGAAGGERHAARHEQEPTGACPRPHGPPAGLISIADPGERARRSL